MSVNSQNFALDIERFAQRVNLRFDVVVRKVSLDILTRIIQRTPVDTGRARANWQVDLDRIPTGTVESIFEGPKGSRSSLPGTIQQGVVAGVLNRINGQTTVYIANNLPYITRLEEGWSGQAPQGMVAITVAEYPLVVKQAVQEAKGTRQ